MVTRSSRTVAAFGVAARATAELRAGTPKAGTRWVRARDHPDLVRTCSSAGRPNPVWMRTVGLPFYRRVSSSRALERYARAGESRHGACSAARTIAQRNGGHGSPPTRECLWLGELGKKSTRLVPERSARTVGHPDAELCGTWAWALRSARR
jgi:hypothetical protein